METGNDGDTTTGYPRRAQAPDRKANIVQQEDAARATVREQYPDWPEELRNLGALFITEFRAQVAWSIGPPLSPAPLILRPHESDCSHCRRWRCMLPVGCVRRKVDRI